ncbi:hypothetical protein [Diaphorobacter caeni]|uniref:hypothetical protein n=1 Tax=Diaphorobacter caeni TaxID=2784387 RepID=UPI0018904C05|nr:hypothetical protein [Diaphorobacter caeni]MBF5006367.1 hypothetical protein [Diaphorobacter caeni]
MPQAAATPPAAKSVTLPAGIEIFRAGTHIDDQGTSHVFSDADVAGMAASYNPATREAPLTIGHPEHNLPAYGWVQSVGRNAAGVLTINPHRVEPQFAEMVAAGRFTKRSASFYPPSAPNNPTPGKWYLRHVAFLGAQPPAIAGLKDIQFSEGDEVGVVSFAETVNADPTQETTDMSKELQAQLDEANAKLKAEQEATTKLKAEKEASDQAAKDAKAAAASFAERAKADRKAGFVSFAEAQIKAGTLLPKDKAMAVATLDMLADAQPVEFSEGDTTKKVSPAQWLQDLITSAKPVVDFSEFAGGKTPVLGSAKGKTDAEIDQAARGYMQQHKGVNYADALTAVTSFTTTA